jgi:hypothetical protein
MKRQPAQQRARPPTLGHRQCNSSRLEREGAEKAHAKHRNRLSVADRHKRLSTRE